MNARSRMMMKTLAVAVLLAPALAAAGKPDYPKLPDDPSKLECDWSGCDLVTVTDAAKAAIEKFPEHEKLGIRFARGSTNAGLATIKKLPWVTKIDLHDGITDLSPLASLAHLDEVAIVDATPSTLAPLAKVATLRVLMLPDALDLAPIAHMKSLRELHAVCGDAACVELIGGMTWLTTLGLRAELGAKDLAAVGKLTALESLALMDTALTDLAAIAPLTRLHKLNLQANPKLAKLDGLLAFPELEDLTIQNGNTAARDPRVLAKLAHLRFLSVEDTLMSEKQKAKFHAAHPDVSVF